jgi:hypothetical protein
MEVEVVSIQFLFTNTNVVLNFEAKCVEKVMDIPVSK